MQSFFVALINKVLVYLGMVKLGEARAKKKQLEADNAEHKKDNAVEAKSNDPRSVFDRLRNLTKRK